MRLMVVRCDATHCTYNKDGYCDGENGVMRVDATEFNNDPTCPPICLTSESNGDISDE